MVLDKHFKDSKKFSFIILMLLLTVLLALLDKVTIPVASVLAVLGGVYPAGQSYIDGKKNNT